MADNKDLLANRLKEINKNKEALKQQQENKKSNVVETIASGDINHDKPDFDKMAEVLESKKEEAKSENDGYIKDTIYIRADLHKAMNALCTRQGDKKRLVNQMYEEFLTKKYKELHKELKIDK